MEKSGLGNDERRLKIGSRGREVGRGAENILKAGRTDEGGKEDEVEE